MQSNNESKTRISFKTFILSYSSQFIGILLSIISIPLLLNFLDRELFGIWSIVFGALNYISLNYLGIPTIVTILVSQLEKNYEKYQTIKKYLFLVIFFSFLLILCLVAFSYYYPNWLLFFGNIRFDNQIPAKISIIVISFALLVRIICSVFLAAFSGFQRPYLVKLYELAYGIASFLALIISFITKKNLLTLAVSTSFCSIVVSLVICSHFYSLNIKSAKLYAKSKSVSTKFLLSYGGTYFKAGVISAAVWLSHIMIISRIVGISNYPPYSLVFRLVTVAFLFGVFLAQTNIAIFGNWVKLKNWSKIKSLYEIQLELFPVLAGIIFISILFFSQNIIEIWTRRPDLYAGLNVAFFLSLYGMLSVYINLFNSLLTILNLPNYIYRIAKFEFFLLIFFTFIFTKIFLLPGAAFALALTSFVILYFILIDLVKKITINNIKFDSVLINKKQIYLLLLFISISYLCLILNNEFFSKVIYFVIIIITYLLISLRLISLNSKTFIKEKFLKVAQRFYY
jgi:O-antigen/teichoic acid export membrane protein